VVSDDDTVLGEEAMMTDSPIRLTSIEEMSDDEISARLKTIRKERMKPVRQFEEVQAIRRQANKDKSLERLDKKLELFVKCDERVMKALTQLEKYAHEIRVLRLEVLE